MLVPKIVVRRSAAPDSAKKCTLEQGETFNVVETATHNGLTRLRLEDGGWTSLTSSKEPSKALVEQIPPDGRPMVSALPAVQLQYLQAKHSAVVQILLKMAAKSGSTELVHEVIALLSNDDDPAVQEQITALRQAQGDNEFAPTTVEANAAAHAAALKTMEDAHESALLSLRRKEEALAAIKAECNDVISHSKLLDESLQEQDADESLWSFEPRDVQASSMLNATKEEARVLLHELDIVDQVEGGMQEPRPGPGSLARYRASPSGHATPITARRRRMMRRHF